MIAAPVTPVTMTSSLTGITHTVNIRISDHKLRAWRAGLLRGRLADVFPELSDYEREFLVTGITESEWRRFVNRRDWCFNPGAGK